MHLEVLLLRDQAKHEHCLPNTQPVKAVRGAALALGIGAGCGRIQYVTVSTLLRLGLTDVGALAGADRRRHDHQPHHQGARRQAVPRLVGSHCRQSDLRRTVGVALLVSKIWQPCACAMWRRNPHRRNHSVFDVDQMRRFAKALSSKLGGVLPWCCIPRLRRTAVSVGRKGLEELRSNAKGRSQYANDQTAI
jgi:hypothetical protein